MTIYSFLLAAILGVMGPGASLRGGHAQPRPLARGNNASTEILAHSAAALFRLDLSTGQPQVQRIGNFGTQITDIAQTDDGRLFGVSFSSLFHIDLQTGRAQLVGRLGTNHANGLAASGRRLVASGTDGALYAIDIASGRSQGVGRFGRGVVSSGDLCFSSGGVLYMTAPVGGQTGSIDQLVRLDPSSGVASPIGSTGQRRVYGMACAGQNLFGLTEGGAIVRLDPQSGAATPIGQVQVPFWGAT